MRPVSYGLIIPIIGTWSNLCRWKRLVLGGGIINELDRLTPETVAVSCQATDARLDLVATILRGLMYNDSMIRLEKGV